MTFEEAKVMLSKLPREDIEDGDACMGDESYWLSSDNQDLASGYFSQDSAEVHIYGATPEDDGCFVDEEARELRTLGIPFTRPKE